jgi:adenylylsulfate kinase|tara:strand:- start:638 stop:1102 length:465 start_codon:yes stop_codon:yes gene_type:complete
MIYWLTGQPAHGKTVLGNLLKTYLENLKNGKDPNKRYKVYRIDGDDMRELFSNKDYSIKGRVENVGTAQRIAHYLHNQGNDVIVSLVAPYIDQREDFKKLLGKNITEIYVHTSEPRERDHFKAIAYTPPVENFIDIDTTDDEPNESLVKIINQI